MNLAHRGSGVLTGAERQFWGSSLAAVPQHVHIYSRVCPGIHFRWHYQVVSGGAWCPSVCSIAVPGYLSPFLVHGFLSSAQFTYKNVNKSSLMFDTAAQTSSISSHHFGIRQQRLQETCP